jgi:hypothetical protein
MNILIFKQVASKLKLNDLIICFNPENEWEFPIGAILKLENFLNDPKIYNEYFNKLFPIIVNEEPINIGDTVIDSELDNIVYDTDKIFLFCKTDKDCEKFNNNNRFYKVIIFPQDISEKNINDFINKKLQHKDYVEITEDNVIYPSKIQILINNCKNFKDKIDSNNREIWDNRGIIKDCEETIQKIEIKNKELNNIIKKSEIEIDILKGNDYINKCYKISEHKFVKIIEKSKYSGFKIERISYDLNNNDRETLNNAFFKIENITLNELKHISLNDISPEEYQIEKDKIKNYLNF